MKRLLLGMLLLGLAAAAAMIFLRAPRGPSARLNVVLITVDTLRADRIGRGLTPAIDRLAASGVRFTNARTTVPLTLPAHTTLLTGTRPTVHGVRDNGVVIDGGVPTLATALDAAGYGTGAMVGAYVLDRRFGLSRGFDVYDDRVRRDPDAVARLEAERPGHEVVDAALSWLETAAPPFFLWVHLYDPHAPYAPPHEYLPAGRAAYDGEVAFADAQVGRLLDRLDERGLSASTVVALAGDHGEGLGEHGESTHGMLAYDTTLRVPLVVAAPDLRAREVGSPVSLADVAGSVLRLAGVTAALAPEASTVDLFNPPDAADVYAETQYPAAAGWHPLAVLAGAQWKLILSSRAELYDVRGDASESNDLASQRPAVVHAMRTKLVEMQAAARAPAGSTLSADAAERLRTLGYVSGSSAAKDVDASAPNPANEIEAWTRFESALGLLNRGDAPGALGELEALAARYPSGLVFQSSLARALQQTGRPRDAVGVLRRAVARWPSDATLFHDLAVAARAAGDTSEAMRAEQAALAIQGDNPAALNGLGLLHADAGRSSDAAAAFERAAGADPSNAVYWSNLGNARREMGDVAAAEAAYRRALDADPGHADAANGLGVLLVQRGRPADAVAWFLRALERSPDHHEARLNLGIAYQESGRRDQAIAAYREVLARAPARFARERQAARDLLDRLTR